MKTILSAWILILIATPTFSQTNQFIITKYGAVADGKTVATKALQTAIDDCNKNGGGEVVIPTGVFITGTVHLKSNVGLYLQNGAVLRGSANLNDYEAYTPEQPYVPIHKGMFFTEDAENITISGNGQIDGNGDVFFELDKAKKLDAMTTRFTRQKEGYRQVAQGIGDGPVVPKDRPYQMFVFSNCKRITIKDIFITTSPFWCMHIADCDAVKVSGIRLWNNLLAPNADGIDITSSTNVIIDGCDIRAGDDAVVVVGYDHHFEIPGYKHLRHISENIIISNCNLQSYSSGIRIGFLDQNTVRNVQVSNINITNSTRGIGIFLRDEGSLENISFSNIYIETKLHTGDWWGNGEPIHISAVRGTEKGKLGQIRHVLFSNIICKGENGMLVYGSDESVIEDLVFEHIRFELTGSPLNSVAGGNIDLRGAAIEKPLFARGLPALLMQYVKGVRINDLQLKWSVTNAPFFTHGIELNHFEEVQIKDFRGTAYPGNTRAYSLFAKDGKGLVSDVKKASSVNVVQ